LAVVAGRFVDETCSGLLACVGHILLDSALEETLASLTAVDGVVESRPFVTTYKADGHLDNWCFTLSVHVLNYLK